MLCVVYKGEQLVQQQADPLHEEHREGAGRGEHGRAASTQATFRPTAASFSRFFQPLPTL